MVILIGVTVVLVLAAALLLVWLLKRERHAHGGRTSAPPMVFLPPEGSAPPIVRAPYVPPQPAPSDDGATRPQLIQEHAITEVTALASAVGSQVSSPMSTGDNNMLALNRRRVPRNRPVADSLAALGTLRMLPGRLVPEDRNALRDDIRFIALATTGEQRFTVGRGEGPLHEHIQIASPTVSRSHATLQYQDGTWSIANLSETNPVRVNGVELRESESIPLAEGDAVEMGDLVLRFRS